MDVDGQWEGVRWFLSRGLRGCGYGCGRIRPDFFTQDSIVMSCGEMGTFGVTGVSEFMDAVAAECKVKTTTRNGQM
jgi:hypothetical protein